MAGPRITFPPRHTQAAHVGRMVHRCGFHLVGTATLDHHVSLGRFIFGRAGHVSHIKASTMSTASESAHKYRS